MADYEVKYEYEVNIDPTEVDKDGWDDWDAGYLWLDNKHGVNYNLYYDGGECSSAIYKMDCDGEYIETDSDTYIHYEIDFNDEDWEQKLVYAMAKAAEKFWKEDM